MIKFLGKRKTCRTNMDERDWEWNLIQRLQRWNFWERSPFRVARRMGGAQRTTFGGELRPGSGYLPERVWLKMDAVRMACARGRMVRFIQAFKSEPYHGLTDFDSIFLL